MLDLLSASPPVGSLRLESMSIAEIDAHPDCDRICATIAAIRDAATEQADEDQVDPDEIHEIATEEKHNSDVAAIKMWSDQVWSDFVDAHPGQNEVPAVKWLQEKISEAEFAL